VTTRNFTKLVELALLLLASIIFAPGCAKQEATDARTPTTVQPTAKVKAVATPMKSRPVTPGTILGRLDAPVQIVIYSDFQCHACEKLHSEAEAELIRDYVNTGKARLEVRLMAALGPESMRAAQAALCAADQGRFWEYRDAILSAWSKDGKAAYSDEELRRAAATVGLNAEAFSACLSSGTKEAEVQENNRKAKADNVSVVPTVFINGHKIVGAQPYGEFQKIIDELLAK